MPVDRAAIKNNAKAILQQIQTKHFGDKKLDDNELEAILKTDEFDSHDKKTKIKFDTDGNGKITASDRNIAILNELLQSADLADTDDLKALLTTLQTQLLAKLSSTKRPPQPKPAGINDNDYKYTDAQKNSPEYGFLNRNLQAHKGNPVDLRGFGADFSKNIIGDEKDVNKQAEKLVKGLWENADFDADGKTPMRILRMAEIHSVSEYIKTLPPGEQEAFKAAFAQKMAVYVDAEFKDNKQFILDSLLASMQATDFSNSPDTKAFTEDFGKRLANALGLIPADNNKVVGKYDGALNNGDFGSLALIKDAAGNLTYLEHETGLDMNKSIFDLTGALAPDDPAAPGAAPAAGPAAPGAAGAVNIGSLGTETEASRKEIFTLLKSLPAADPTFTNARIEVTNQEAKIQPAPDDISTLITKGDLKSLEEMLLAFQSIEGKLPAGEQKTKIQAFITKLEKLIEEAKKSVEFNQKTLTIQVSGEFEKVRAEILAKGIPAGDLDLLKNLKLGEVANDPIKLAETIEKLEAILNSIGAAFPDAHPGTIPGDEKKSLALNNGYFALETLIGSLKNIKAETTIKKPAKDLHDQIDTTKKSDPYLILKGILGAGDLDIAAFEASIAAGPAGIEVALQTKVGVEAGLSVIKNLIKKTLEANNNLGGKKAEFIDSLRKIAAQIIDGYSKQLLGDDDLIGANPAIKVAVKASGLNEINIQAVINNPVELQKYIDKLTAIKAAIPAPVVVGSVEEKINGEIDSLIAILTANKSNISVNLALKTLTGDGELNKPVVDGGEKDLMDGIKNISFEDAVSNSSKRTELMGKLQELFKKVKDEITLIGVPVPPAKAARHAELIRRQGLIQNGIDQVNNLL